MPGSGALFYETIAALSLLLQDLFHTVTQQGFFWSNHACNIQLSHFYACSLLNTYHTLQQIRRHGWSLTWDLFSMCRALGTLIFAQPLAGSIVLYARSGSYTLYVCYGLHSSFRCSPPHFHSDAVTLSSQPEHVLAGSGLSPDERASLHDARGQWSALHLFCELA